MNHWNGGNYYKYIESISGGRGNTTGLERVNLINNLGAGTHSLNQLNEAADKLVKTNMLRQYEITRWFRLLTSFRKKFLELD